MCEEIIKRPLVLWSGGLDSTALVIDLLHDGDIDVMYVHLENNRKQQHYEQQAITKLKCLIADANLNGKIVNEHTFGYTQIMTQKQVFAQPPLWINAATFLADSQHHNSVNIAYVKLDDVWHYKTQVTDAYTAISKLIAYDDEIVPLKFPYEWCTKQSLVDQLKDFVYTEQVMQTVRYCEMHGKEPCGECTSCKRHNTEINTSILDHFVKIDMTDEFKQFEADKADEKAKEAEHD